MRAQQSGSIREIRVIRDKAVAVAVTVATGATPMRRPPLALARGAAHHSASSHHIAPSRSITVSVSRPIFAALGAAAIFFALPAHAQAQRADLVLLHGTIVTVDSARPTAEAIAVRGDRIMAV